MRDTITADDLRERLRAVRRQHAALNPRDLTFMGHLAGREHELTSMLNDLGHYDTDAEDDPDAY